MTKPISLSSARRRFTWSRWSLMLSVDVVSQLYLIGTGRNGRFGAVEAKGLVGKLPGNPASCQEEPCNSDPQHVLAALKVMCIFLGSVLILPLLLYYLSKLFTKLRMMCCPAKDDDESCKADEEAMVGEDLKKESNNSNNNNNNNNDARKGSKRGKSNQFSGEPNTGSKRKSQEASSISILSGNFTTNKEGLLEQSCASGAPSALLSSSNQQQSSHNHQDNYYKLSTSDDVEEFDAQSPKVGPNVVGRKQSRLKARVSLEQENDTSQSGQQQEQQQQQQKRHQSVQYQAQQRHYTNQAGKLNGAELARFSPVGHDSPGLGAPMDSPLILSEGGVLPGYNKQHQLTRTGANWSQQQQQHRQAFDVGGGGEFDQSSIEFGKTGAGQQQKQFNNFQQHRYSMYFGANGRTIGVAPGGGGNAGNYLMQNSRRANQNLANNNNTTTSGLATLTVDGRQLDRMRRSSLRSPVALEQTMLIANANNSIRRKRPPSTQNKVYPATTTAATAVGQNQGDNDAAADGGLSHNYHHHHHHLASSLLDDRLDNSGAAAFNGQVCPAGYATQRQTNSAHLHHEQQQHEYQTQMNSTNQHIKVDTDRALSSRLELSLLAAPPVGSTAEHRHSIDGSILNNMLLNRQQSPNGRTAAQSSNEQQHRKRQQQQQQQQQLELEHYQQQQQQQLILDRDQSDGGELGVTGTGTGMGTGTGGTPLAVSLESSSGEQQKQTKANGKRRQSKAAQKRLEQLELRQAQNQLAAASQHQQYLDNARGSGANGGERNDGDDDDDGGDGDDCSGLNGGDQDQARQGGRLFGERHHRHSTVSNNNKLMAGGGHELASEVQQLADHFPHQHLPVSSQHQHQQQQQQYHQQQQQQQQQRRPSLNTLSKPSPVRH